ncbi:hypothetical protein GCM10011503_12910 [Henriciella pelagia]|uniref:Uncharacterized protein n=1 Tax=Henriciella pelagia TaxID=1977912 RepID=A0ABQ1JG35_9PROT|nr:hypothetical protein GCM10011503_12910 [Henriciella pelagia]
MGERAAKREAHQDKPSQAGLLKAANRNPGKAGRCQREGGKRRLSGTRHFQRDEGAVAKLARQWLCDFEARSDAIQEDDRLSCGIRVPDMGAQAYAGGIAPYLVRTFILG